MTNDEYEALLSAESICLLLYWREQSSIRTLDPEYVALLDDALRKIAPLTRAEQQQRRQHV